MNVRRLIATAVASSFVASCLGASACSASAGSDAARPDPASTRVSGRSQVAIRAIGTGPASVLGVVTNNVTKFDKATGVNVNLEVRYLTWGDDLPVQQLAGMESAGILPLVELEPVGVSLRAIAGGGQDAYIGKLADEAKSLNGKLSISFAPEMNGNWYSWGGDPSQFVKAWRHFVAVFKDAKATNVDWVWIIHHVEHAAVSQLPAYWPGASWVSWVGLDGYYERSPETFQTIFGPSLGEVKKITKDPVLITETAVGPVAGNVPAKIDNLFDSIRPDRLLGLVWFDIKQDDPPVHQNWNLESRPAALAAFRAAAKRIFPQLEG